MIYPVTCVGMRTHPVPIRWQKLTRRNKFASPSTAAVSTSNIEIPRAVHQAYVYIVVTAFDLSLAGTDFRLQ